MAKYNWYGLAVPPRKGNCFTAANKHEIKIRFAIRLRLSKNIYHHICIKLQHKRDVWTENIPPVLLTWSENDSYFLSLRYWYSCIVFLFKFRQEYLDTLYRYAKFQYECGNYSGAAEYLYFFRVLVSLQLLSHTFNTIPFLLITVDLTLLNRLSVVFYQPPVCTK